jgi:hypothetical protein
MSTPILTETVIDIADQHTTLFYLKKKSKDSPLPFTRANGYNSLHKSIAGKGRDFSDVHPQDQAQTLKRLSPAYANYKYWSRILLSDQVESYAQRAWADLLPITASLIPRIDILKAPKVNCRVTPVPRVTLYPFGWSTWISVRILGAHTIDELAEFVESTFNSPVFQFAASKSPVTLEQAMRQISDGVRADAFGGDVNDKMPSELTLVTTVLAKHNGSPSVAAAGAYEPALRRMINPKNPLSTKKFADLAYRFDPNDPFEFMLNDDHLRFIWLEHLLNPDERNHKLLRCYHQNSFRLLVHARHLLGLMNEAVTQKVRTVPLLELVDGAVRFLDEPVFRNASFVAFLDDPKVDKSLQRASKWVNNQP